MGSAGNGAPFGSALAPVYSGAAAPQTGLEDAARAVQEIIDQGRTKEPK